MQLFIQNDPFYLYFVLFLYHLFIVILSLFIFIFMKGDSEAVKDDVFKRK
jgi:hypothetical protein